MLKAAVGGAPLPAPSVYGSAAGRHKVETSQRDEEPVRKRVHHAKKEEEAGQPAKVEHTLAGFQLYGDGVFMVSVKDIEDVEGRNALQIVLWQCSLWSMSTRSAQKCLYRCRTGTVVWRVGSGSCPSLGTARRTCVGVAGREELQVVAQATSSTYETALRASGVDGVVTCLSSQQRRKNTLQIGAAASGFLVGWSTEANCMVGGSRVWCGDISHGTVRQKRSSSSCSPSITQSSWKTVECVWTALTEPRCSNRHLRRLDGRDRTPHQ